MSKFRHIGATGDRADTNIESRLLRDRAGGYRAGKTCQHGMSLTLLNIQVAVIKQ